MDERDFVSKKRQAWDQLAALIAKANGKGGLKSLSREEILSLGPLYRRVSSDLAYARAHAVSTDLAVHLNGLVGRAHALLYEAERSQSALGSVIQFYWIDFPTLLQKHYRYFLSAVALAVFGAFFAYWLVIRQPDKLSLFVGPGFKDAVEYWKSGKVTADPSIEFAAMLMTHNQQVGLMSFALGVVGGAPDAYLMFQTGGMLGAMAALMTQVHHHDTFWPGIVPHGVAELTAIFICGAAGFRLGFSWLFPGRYRRVEAFQNAGLDAIKLVLGTIPLFIFAGIIEAMFSRIALAASVRYAFAILNGVLWYAYLFIPRFQPGERGAKPGKRNLPPAASVQSREHATGAHAA
ncbi:MAG TPA: stage II sporulation protein M [Chthonomonadaceae bacterium]|nr:stage II sporulation protein M [Chthonomonadaceae bacterium]